MAQACSVRVGTGRDDQDARCDWSLMVGGKIEDGADISEGSHVDGN